MRERVKEKRRFTQQLLQRDEKIDRKNAQQRERKLEDLGGCVWGGQKRG